MYDLSGQTIVITGANSGIGKETARELGRMGARIVLVCRTKERGEEALKELSLENPGRFDLLIADLSSLKNIESLAETLKKNYPKIDVLLHNAGVFFEKRVESVDGIEMTLAVNHVAVFHLTMLMLEHLKAGGSSRIIIVSSEAHLKGQVNLEDLEFKKRKFRLLEAYGQSKLLNVLFMKELNRKIKGSGLTINCVHPGVVGTNIVAANSGPFLKLVWKFGSLFMLTASQGARTSIKVAADPSLKDITDKYFEKEKISKYNRIADDEKLAKDVWRATENILQALLDK